jgi:4-amino-4-deoxy-L-arabinose transferase-like glycosyltransferase
VVGEVGGNAPRRSVRPVHVALVLLVAAAPISLVLLHARAVGLDSLHLLGLHETLNDQVVYVDAARRWLRTGRLDAGVIYPSTLLQDYGRSFLYMPGHVAMLAGSLGLLGDGVVASMLPSWIAHAISIFCVFAIGRKLVDARAGGFAAFVYAMMPVHLVYAFTAMAESTTLAAGLASLAIFVHWPARTRPWAAPLLLIVPFLFRETAAFWIAPMVVLLVTEADRAPRARWTRAAIALVGSVLVLGLVQRIPWIADRPSLFVQNLVGRTFAEKYTDAYAAAALDSGPAALATSILSLGGANAARLMELLATPSLESAMLHALLWIPLAGALVAWQTPRLRPLVLAWALFFAVGFGFTTFFYRWGYFVGVRQLLPSATLGLVVVGAAISERVPRRPSWRAIVALVLVWILAVAIVRVQAAAITASDAREDRIRQAVDRLSLPEGGLLIAHHNLGLVYLYDHPLHRVALFPPADPRTLRLLDERFDVRAGLLRPQDLERLPPAALAAAGLVDRGRLGALRFYVEPDPEPGSARDGSAEEFGRRR